MSHSFGASHMCDGGIDEVTEGIKNAVEKTIRNCVDIIESVDLTDEQKTKLADEIVDDLDSDLDPELENVVQAIDNHLEECVTSAKDEGYENGQESVYENGDYYSYDEHSREIEEKDDEIKELEEQLENRPEDGQVHPHGFVDPLEWNEGRQVFVCPKTLRRYKLVETDEM